MQTNGHSETLADVEQSALELLASSHREQREGLELNSPAASVLKHIESIVERAVHGQVEPLQQLIVGAEELIRNQFDHLARIKAEVTIMMQNGERIATAAKAVHSEIKDMRARHADLIEAKTQ